MLIKNKFINPLAPFNETDNHLSIMSKSFNADILIFEPELVIFLMLKTKGTL